MRWRVRWRGEGGRRVHSNLVRLLRAWALDVDLLGVGVDCCCAGFNFLWPRRKGTQGCCWCWWAVGRGVFRAEGQGGQRTMSA